MHDVRWWVLVALLACSQSELKNPGKPAPAEPSTPACAQDLYAGFATPQLAYEAYATALNAKDYCRAANTYARDQRAELANATLSVLVITAGTTVADNKDAFRTRLRQICATYGLSCDRDQRVTELATDLRAGTPLQTLEPKFAEVMRQRPEDVFRDVMKTLADVEPGAVGQLSTELKDLRIEGGRATARVERTTASRRETAVFLSAGANGWMLTLR